VNFAIIQEPKGQKLARGRAFQVVGRTIAGKPRRLYAEQLLEEEKPLALMYMHRSPESLQGPLILGIKAFLPLLPRSKSKRWQAEVLAGEIRPTNKADLDNCIKNLKEVCNGVLGQNDKQEVKYLPETGKYYGDPGRWEVEIELMDQVILRGWL
jgi:Holliday junction resolvase RusA-like endonuclease